MEVFPKIVDEIWDGTQCVVEDFGYLMKKGEPLKNCFVGCEEEVFKEVGLWHWKTYKQVICLVG